MTPLHIIAGLLGIASGFVALFASKGGTLHRRSGMVFVCAMLVMSASGATLAALRDNAFTRLNVVAGVLTFYLVVTALLTVRRPAYARPWIDEAAVLVAVTVGVASLSFGVAATGRSSGVPVTMYFVFGTLASLAALGDMRRMERGVDGARRIARHLWRMGAALWIATSSLFLGQAQVFPEAVRKRALLTIPVLLVLVVVLYWLVRVLFMTRHPRIQSLVRGDLPG